MQNRVTHMPTEADVGSGEKGPGERETEKMIEQVGDKVDETHREEKKPDSDKPAS
ncbi:MAG: hypothetical protein ABWY05_14480 [Noviherbaspirillum sp.]